MQGDRGKPTACFTWPERIMEIEKYIITYKIGNDIPINPDWIRTKLQAAVKELQAEIDKKPLHGQHVLTLE
jgi:hypothetical protein